MGIWVKTEILYRFIPIFNLWIDSGDNSWCIFQLIIAKKENVGESPRERGELGVAQL